MDRWARRHGRGLVLVLTLCVASSAADTANTPLSGPLSAQDRDAIAIAAGATKGNCFNPLFKTHWAGKSDIRHLASKPQMQQGLRLCPAYNARQGCCLNSFEHILSKVFQRWVKHWKRKSQYIEDFQVQMAKIRVSRQYAKADKLERALFDKTVASYAQVIKWQGTCFDTLLEYTAGMLCFACDPDWGKKVFFGQGGRSVTHLHVADYSNEALWQGCRALGAAATEAQTRVADSLLVKGVWERFEDLSMFKDKISVSQYMANIGLYTIHGPSEKQLVLSPGGADVQSRRLAAADGPSAYVDPVRSGRSSGFQCSVFPRIPFGVSSGNSEAFAVLQPLLMLTVLLWQAL